MKKVSAREFQHHFGKLAAELKPGETVQVTRNGQIDGVYQKVPDRKIRFPDFKKRLEQHDYSSKIGETLLKTLDGTVS